MHRYGTSIEQWKTTNASTLSQLSTANKLPVRDGVGNSTAWYVPGFGLVWSDLVQFVHK